MFQTDSSYSLIGEMSQSTTSLQTVCSDWDENENVDETTLNPWTDKFYAETLKAWVLIEDITMLYNPELGIYPDKPITMKAYNYKCICCDLEPRNFFLRGQSPLYSQPPPSSGSTSAAQDKITSDTINNIAQHKDMPLIDAEASNNTKLFPAPFGTNKVHPQNQLTSIATINDVLIDTEDVDNETKDTGCNGTAKKTKDDRKVKNKKNILRRIGNRILRFACIRPKATGR